MNVVRCAHSMLLRLKSMHFMTARMSNVRGYSLAIYIWHMAFMCGIFGALRLLRISKGTQFI